MKIPSITIALLFATGASVVSAKECTTGTEKECPKGQVCVVPIYSHPGTKGVCGKECNAGTMKPCPKGQYCYVEDPDLPGSAGGCIKEDLCYEPIGILNEFQDKIMDRVVEVDEMLDPEWQAIFHLLLNGTEIPQQCAGPNKIECTGENDFCFMDPLNDNPYAFGDCIPDENDEVCRTGTLNACPKGEVCMAIEGEPPGSWGWCAPKGTKRCDKGTKDPCGKGTDVCFSLSTDDLGAAGICVSECEYKHIEVDQYTYWMTKEAADAFWYGLNDVHKAEVKAEIGL